MYKYTLKSQYGRENTQVYETCADIRARVKQSRKKATIYDYPSVAVGCHTGYHVLYINTTHSRPDYKQTRILLDALQSIGTIGKTRKQCKNIIGACAEPKVAHYALTQGAFNIKKLCFTQAYRPRTGEPVKYCRNCKDVFGL